MPSTGSRRSLITTTQAQVENRQLQVELNGLWGLSFVHDLLLHTLEELVADGAAAREFVDFEDKVLWGEPSSKEPADQKAWLAAEEEHYEKGLKAFDRENWRDAIGHLEAALALNPDDVDILVEWASAHAELGNTDLALAGLERARSLDDDPESVRIVEEALNEVRNRIN